MLDLSLRVLGERFPETVTVRDSKVRVELMEGNRSIRLAIENYVYGDKPLMGLLKLHGPSDNSEMTIQYTPSLSDLGEGIVRDSSKFDKDGKYLRQGHIQAAFNGGFEGTASANRTLEWARRELSAVNGEWFRVS